MTGVVTVFDVRGDGKRMDESGPITPPAVMPSPIEGAGGTAQRTIDKTNGLLRQLDLALAIVYRLLPRDKDGNVCGISFDAWRTEAGPRAQIVRFENSYNVSERKANGS